MNVERSILKKTTRMALAVALASAVVSVNGARAESVGSFNEGRALGKNNGALLSERLYKRTIGNSRLGCGALGQYQDALNTVTARVRPVGGHGSQFTAGFYAGYVEAIREAVRGARKECSRARFNDGSFPGEFFANIFCQVAAVEPRALAEIGFGPIYDGWSHGSEARDDCALVFSLVTSECATTGIAAELLAQTQASVCAD